jgi:arginase
MIFNKIKFFFNKRIPFIYSRNVRFNNLHYKGNLIVNKSEISQLYKKALFEQKTQMFLNTNVVKNISIIEIPMKYGQNLNGVDKAPEFINKELQILINNNKNWNLKNVIKIPIIKCYNCSSATRGTLVALRAKTKIANISYKAQNLRDIGFNSKNIAEICYSQSIKNSFVLTIGGDHSISIGSISGILKQNPDIGIIWIDAHPDIHTIKSSFTKHIHGMVNGFLLRLIDIKEFSWLNDYPKLKPNQIAYIGLRSIDKAEYNTLFKLKKNGMFVSTINDIQQKGIENIINEAIISLGKKNIHISFDIDAIDPSIAPSTGTKCNNGLSYNDTIEIISLIKQKCCITSMDIVEFNPNIGNKKDVNKTTKIILDIIKNVLD